MRALLLPAGLAFQLTHSVNMDPSFAPDGKRMVYISIVGGREQLFVANIDGTKPVQITHDDWDHEDPAWSPDGKHIAFTSLEGGGEVVSVMDADGTHAEPLAPKTQRTIHPSWTPDSAKVTYCTDDDLKPPKKNASEIYTIDVATKKVVKLIAGGVNTFPVWSPDGKQLAFRRMIGEMNSEVFVANADGSNAHNVTKHPAFDGWPAWSPDGKRIAFASNRRSAYEIYVMKPDGSDVRLVANTDGRGTAPKWTPDGASIYYTICKNVDLGYDCQIYAASAP